MFFIRHLLFLLKEILQDLRKPYFLNHLIVLCVSFIFCLLVTYIIFKFFIEFSAIAVALDFVWLSLFIWFFLDLFWFREVDFIYEMRNNPYFLAALVLGIFILLAAVSARSEERINFFSKIDSVYVDSQTVRSSFPHLDTALSYVGVQEETGNNDGEIVERFIKTTDPIHGKKGYAWCAAFVSYCLIVNNAKFPKYRGFLARGFARGGISIEEAIQKNKVSSGDILVWRRGDTIFGHTGFVESYDSTRKIFYTVEGNTSPDDKGRLSRQYNGDGVYLKKRTYQPMNYFRLMAVTPVTYE